MAGLLTYLQHYLETVNNANILPCDTLLPGSGHGDRNSSVNTTTAGWRKRYLSSQRPNTMSGESKYLRQPPFFTALFRSWVKGQESPQTLFRVPYFPWSLCVDPPVSVSSCHGSRVTKCPHITSHPGPGHQDKPDNFPACWLAAALHWAVELAMNLRQVSLCPDKAPTKLKGRLNFMSNCLGACLA